MYLLSFLILFTTTDSIKLRGKWGIEVTPSYEIVRAECDFLGLMYGITSKTLAICGFSAYFEPTELGNVSFKIGLRRFLYSNKKISPYYGLVFIPCYSKYREKITLTISGGVEYFINEHISLAAHCRIFRCDGYRRRKYNKKNIRWLFSIGGRPYLSVRFYF